MTQTLISVDLDWLNGRTNPLSVLKRLLKYIPKNIPTVMTIEHHEFLPSLRQWIKSGRVLTPFNVINIDEHHDYYNKPPPRGPNNTRVDCGNWGYHMPVKWYDRYTWIHNSNYGLYDWVNAKKWFGSRGIDYSIRKKHRLSELRTDIVAAVFCVSPDYLRGEMNEHIIEAVNMVVCHFGMEEAPKKISGGNVMQVNGWRIAPRPLVKTI